LFDDTTTNETYTFSDAAERAASEKNSLSFPEQIRFLFFAVPCPVEFITIPPGSAKNKNFFSADSAPRVPPKAGRAVSHS
jgi:hypothetical protein